MVLGQWCLNDNYGRRKSKIIIQHFVHKKQKLNNNAKIYRIYFCLFFRVVISELTFYLETLRTLKVLPTEELMMGTMEDIWAR
jgi:hypothetical protein